MPELSDEILMAYADGELPAVERARVDAILARSPEARARLAAFTATGRGLASKFDKQLRAPVPKHLVDLVLTGPRQVDERRDTAPVERRHSRFGALLGQSRLSLPLRGTPALAASLALLFGAGAGWLAHSQLRRVGGEDKELVVMENGAVHASGALARLLATTPSGRQISASSGDGRDTLINPSGSPQLRSLLSFKTSAGYCRQFEIASPGGSATAGIACRDTNSGRWRIEMHWATESGPATSEKVRPAGRDEPSPLQTFMNRRMDGDALGIEDEAAAIKNNWRPVR